VGEERLQPPLGRGLGGDRPERAAHLGDVLQHVPAAGAPIDVLAERTRLRGRGLAVGQLEEPVVVRMHGHGGPHATCPPADASMPAAVSRVRRASSAYRIRLFTVGSGAPVIRAISWKGMPAISRRRNTSRWASGSAAIAASSTGRSSDAAAARSGSCASVDTGSVTSGSAARARSRRAPSTQAFLAMVYSQVVKRARGLQSLEARTTF